ncbi:BRCT domain-containing protein [Azotobacter vinelandii]|uniref:BRCT domain-containing protein n=1 Tax=Azotobacter vinelandii TaxID=354 RepID=UPI000774DC76|nr:BRCT domain-containing protein [Azotobacter vinelandii]WKN21515.1 BRCT domain-containing protein [Azotobacter vinelandii]
MSDLHREFENSRFYNTERMDRRSADVLTGIAAGIISDGIVKVEEARFLQQWMESQLAHLEDPVINLLYQRISLMLQDGALDSEESAELLDILRSFTGLKVSAPAKALANGLPLNDPEPEIAWNERIFVFTGVMAFGPRKECERLVRERGGAIGSGVSKKIDYLVVGSVGNEQWRHSSYGTKIIRAVELREAGTPIAIVGEEQWQRVLFS